MMGLVAIGCGGRPIGAPADGQVLDAFSEDAGRDQSSGAFCATGPKVMIDGALLTVSRVESGPIYMGCCDGWYARFVAVRPAGQEVRVTFSLKWAGGTPPSPPQHLDLSQKPQGGSGFSVACDPVAACGVLSPLEASFKGTLDTTPTGAFPGHHIDLCLTATPKGSDKTLKPVRLSAKQQLIVLTNPQCDWGKDWTCNHDPVSSIKGRCNGDGTCTCHAGSKKVPSSGKCR